MVGAINNFLTIEVAMLLL